jgi:hypothetical protein
MAKKKHQDVGVAVDQPAGDNGQQPGGDSPREQPADKAQAVRQALKEGLTSPTEIAKHIQAVYGMSITPNYVSVIKGQERGKGGKGKKKRAQAQAQEKTSTAKATGAGKSGLSPQDLVTLAGLAEKAGGVKKLQDFLSALHLLK